MNSKSTNKKTILVIEDERPLVQVVQTKLENVGFEVVTARTVDQGLDYMKEIDTIDAIWLDHYLPGEKTGLDFVIKLKAPGSKWAKIPIFVVSNTASSGNLKSYMHLGVNKYSIKAEHRLDEITNDVKLFLDKAKD